MTLAQRRVALSAALVTLVIHAIGNPHYGFFRDELYFIICGFHPQFGYVDQPPLVPLLAAATQIFGHSLFLLRLVPALLAAGSVYVTCELVVEFGGGTFAQVLAAILAGLFPVLMSFGMKVGTDEVNLLTWPLIALFLVRMVRGGDLRYWIGIGIAEGLTVNSKYSVLFFIIAYTIGLLLTPQRRIFWSKWFVVGGAVAILLAVPNFLWQAHYGFPMVELLRNGQLGKNLEVGPLMFMVQELIITGIFTCIFWIIGLIWLLRTPMLRFLGFTYIVLILEMLAFHGKHYYPAAIYPILLAAGATAVMNAVSFRGRRIAEPLKYALLAYALITGVIFVPIALPVLPEESFVAYANALSSALHISKQSTATEHGRESSTLPGDWADMHGWPELAQTVSNIYNSLPPGDRAQAVAVASNYGEAAAVQFFAPNVPVISGHNQYWLWGYDHYSGNVIIDINGDCGASIHAFDSARRAATFSDRWAIGYENGIPIMVCKGLRIPLPALWPKVKHFL